MNLRWRSPQAYPRHSCHEPPSSSRFHHTHTRSWRLGEISPNSSVDRTGNNEYIEKNNKLLNIMESPDGCIRFRPEASRIVGRATLPDIGPLKTRLRLDIPPLSGKVARPTY
jgi:hypothetical protein